MGEGTRAEGGQRASMRCPVRRGFRVVLAGLLLLTGVVAYMGIVRSWLDGRRMAGVAARLTERIEVGATVDEVTATIDAMGLGHSPIVDAETWERKGPGGAGRARPWEHAPVAEDARSGVMFVMIHHEVEPWRPTSRDVQVRVYFDAARRVERIETRDVVTGP